MPITAAVWVSAIAVRAASAAALVRAPRLPPASSSELKLIVYFPIFPLDCASRSFAPSAMSREIPRPGLGSDA